MTVAEALEKIGQMDLAQLLPAVAVIGLLVSFAIRQRASGPSDAKSE
jgi:hypothetical protein